MHRFALYFAPERTHPLWRAGCTLLGRDPETGERLAQPRVDGIAPDRLAAITESPRRYGWHATLKAPFMLADGETEASLADAIGHFARQRRAFPMPPLRLAALSGFLALVPASPSPALDALAADIVETFDCFRRPASAEEMARRRRAGLDDAEERNLARWGYPYVMDRFRFHMTLTERLDDQASARLAASLSAHLAPALAVPLQASSIALFAEEAPGAPFVLLRRFPFAA